MSVKQTHHKRTRKLIKPGIQLRISGIIFGVVLLGVLLQAMLFSWSLAATANEMTTGGDYLVQLIQPTVTRTLLATACLILPLVIAVGVLSTFNMVGPVYRMEEYLRQVIRGEKVGPCVIRQKDVFQELCSLLNQALETTRQQTATSDSAEDPSDHSRAA